MAKRREGLSLEPTRRSLGWEAIALDIFVDSTLRQHRQLIQFTVSNMYKQGLCVLTCPKLRTTYTHGSSALYPQFFPFTEVYVSLYLFSLYLFTHIALL